MKIKEERFIRGNKFIQLENDERWFLIAGNWFEIMNRQSLFQKRYLIKWCEAQYINSYRAYEYMQSDFWQHCLLKTDEGKLITAYFLEPDCKYPTHYENNWISIE